MRTEGRRIPEIVSFRLKEHSAILSIGMECSGEFNGIFFLDVASGVVHLTGYLVEDDRDMEDYGEDSMEEMEDLSEEDAEETDSEEDSEEESDEEDSEEGQWAAPVAVIDLFGSTPYSVAPPTFYSFLFPQRFLS